ncbi:hypothetical protein LTR94_034816, partial [Friedmanniomyces endolithicus]
SLAAFPHGRRPLRSARPGRPAPGKSRGDGRALDERGEEIPCAAAVRPGRHGHPQDGIQAARAAQPAVCLLPGHQHRAGTLRRQYPRRLVQGAGGCRVHRRQPGHPVRPRFTLRRACA